MILAAKSGDFAERRLSQSGAIKQLRIQLLMDLRMILKH